MTSAPPLRGIETAAPASRPAARRAIEPEPPQRKPVNFRLTIPTIAEGRIGFGRAEKQLVTSLALTAAVVIGFTVVLPLLMSWVRNF